MKLENIIIENYRQFDTAELAFDQGITILAYSARTAHPFQRNGAPFRFKLSKAQQVD